MKKFKLVTLLGIRPDYIRMFKLIKLLDNHSDGVEHILVHSGQHYDAELFSNFLAEFDIRQPDFDLGIGLTLKKRGKSNHAYQIALLSERVFDLIEKIQPDAVMYLGDTNTILSAITVARCGVPVIHLEAGGRSFDWRMPEEKNRIIIDHLSDAVYCYLDRYRNILISEGVDDSRITVIGNMIVDAVDDLIVRADKSSIMESLGVQSKQFILVTLHREENVTDEAILKNKLEDIAKFAKSQKMTVIFPLMPRPKALIDQHGLGYILDDPIFVKTAPLGFANFLHLEKEARLIVSDSGTVQEEALLVGTPCVIARRSTERPETIWAGATVLEGQEGEGTLYQKMTEAFNIPTDWDKTVLNPEGGSPSERVYQDLINKIKTVFFDNSRTFKQLKHNKLARQAYGERPD